jgi:hypothetical protein
MKSWVIYKAGSFHILADVESNSEIGQLSCTKSEAALIASAPELFETLEKLTERLLHLKNTNGVQDIIAKQLDDALKAIKKVKGE